ncbi:MAG: ADP-ribosyltransferase, partial [Saprospiraceae bacterium]
GYSSFSESIHKAHSWKGGKFSSPSSYLITVRNPKKGKAIKNISKYEGEKEVLWDAGSSFKIVRINKKRRVVVVEEV